MISGLLCITLFALSVNSFGQPFLNVTITDNGPTPITGYYTYTITVVEVDQYNNIVGSFPATPGGGWYPTPTSFPTTLNFTCGVPRDVTEKIYRVDIDVWRDSTTPPVAPFLATGSGSSALLNSDDFYSASGINVTVEIRP